VQNGVPRLQETIDKHGKPEIFNTDQGSQCTSEVHVNIYLRSNRTGLELYKGLKTYFKFYNPERFHESLDYMTPEQRYKPTAA
jgi:putative transposase